MIETSGAAAKAGLQVGDAIVAVDGASVTDIDGRATTAVITQRPVGTTTALTIQRGAATRTLTVTVHAADESSQRFLALGIYVPRCRTSRSF